MVIGRVRVQAEAAGICTRVGDVGPEFALFIREGAFTLVGFAFPDGSYLVAIVGTRDQIFSRVYIRSTQRNVIQEYITSSISIPIDIEAHEIPRSVACREHMVRT